MSEKIKKTESNVGPGGMVARDFLGRELRMDDWIVYSITSGRSCFMCLARVAGFYWKTKTGYWDGKRRETRETFSLSVLKASRGGHHAFWPTQRGHGKEVAIHRTDNVLILSPDQVAAHEAMMARRTADDPSEV